MQIGTNFRSSKYRKLNKIVPRIYTQYYHIYWIYQNEVYNNLDIQIKRVKLWYENVIKDVESKNYPQVKIFIHINELNIKDINLD